MAGLSKSEELLIHNTLNEVINGLPFDRQVGCQENLEALFKEWKNKPQLDLAVRNEKILEKAVRFAIKELGPEEFSIRIGVEIKDAETFLLRLCRLNDTTR